MNDGEVAQAMAIAQNPGNEGPAAENPVGGNGLVNGYSSDSSSWDEEDLNEYVDHQAVMQGAIDSSSDDDLVIAGNEGNLEPDDLAIADEGVEDDVQDGQVDQVDHAQSDTDPPQPSSTNEISVHSPTSSKFWLHLGLFGTLK